MNAVPHQSTRSQSAIGPERAVGHVILVGYGPGGRRIARSLMGIGVDVVVVEADPVRASLAQNEGRAVVHGDATDPTVLRQASPGRAEVVAVTPKRLDERIVKAIRRVKPEGVILTHVSKGFTEPGVVDATAGMLGRMLRLLARPAFERQ